MSLDQIIAMRRSIRNFTHEVPKKEDMDSILASAIYAPYGSMAGLPLEEVRKIFVIAQHSPTMEVAKSILLTHMKKASKGITLLLRFLPFLKKKMQPFAEKLFRLSSMMKTEEGKRMAKDRHDFMKMFADQWQKEYNDTT